MCGLIGSIGSEGISASVLGTLAHRGQTGCGFVYYDTQMYREVSSGGSEELINDIPHSPLFTLGHTRYPTSGCSVSVDNLQPFIWQDSATFVFNGNVFGYEQVELWCQHKDYQFQSDGDTERLAASFFLLLQEQGSYSETSFKDVLQKIAHSFQGAYSAVGSSADWGMIAFRDPLGIRPLEWGVSADGGVFFASETVAFPEDITHHGHVPAGGYVWVDLNGEIHQGLYADEPCLSPDAFEYLYFSHPDSILNEVSVREVRQSLGEALGRQIQKRWPDKDFLVIPVPKTSWDIAPFVAEGKWEYHRDAIAVTNARRTFIEPTQEARKLAVKNKHRVGLIQSQKPVLLVDDSIVRGTTLRTLIEEVRRQGATEVYIASSCPPVMHPDFYGISMPTYAELVASDKTEQEVCQDLGADGLLYLSIEEMQRCILNGAPFTELSMPYLDGKYLRGRND